MTDDSEGRTGGGAGERTGGDAVDGPDDGEGGDGDDRREVPVADWGAVREALRRFAAGGDGDYREAGAGTGAGAGDVERAVCDWGRATFAVTAEGDVSGAMPLHEFDGRASSLAFDFAAGTVEVRGPEMTYTYRRP